MFVKSINYQAQVLIDDGNSFVAEKLSAYLFDHRVGFLTLVRSAIQGSTVLVQVEHKTVAVDPESTISNATSSHLFREILSMRRLDAMG